MGLDGNYRVVYAPDVAVQIERALGWWAAHRDKAPDLLARELERVLALLATSPGLGQRAATRRFGRLHRMMLPRTRFHLYYRILDDEECVQIVLFRQAEKRPLP